MDRPLFILGFMGSGKTTAGRRLALELGVQFYDMDQEVERMAGMSVRDIFRLRSEEVFRELEAVVLERFLNCREGCIVATGGGTALQEEALERMNRAGYTVYLYVEPEHLISRLSRNRFRRPLIAHMDAAELERYVHRTLAEREPRYRGANLTVDAQAIRGDMLMQLLELNAQYERSLPLEEDVPDESDAGDDVIE